MGFWDFPGGPVVKTPSFHCKGHGFKGHRAAKKIKKKKKVRIQSFLKNVLELVTVMVAQL